jgi:hypothetical protein
VQYAKGLLNAVQVFKLPPSGKQDIEGLVVSPGKSSPELVHKKAS